MIRVEYKVWETRPEQVIAQYVGAAPSARGRWLLVHEDFATKDEAAEFIAELKDDGHRFVGWRNI